jgi:hypothetical protein
MKKKTWITILIITFFIVVVFIPLEASKKNKLTQEGTKKINVTPTAILPTKIPTPTTIKTPVDTSFDSSIGNNYVAAKYAKQFQDLADDVASGYVSSVYLELEPSDIKNKSEDDYKQSITSAFLNIEVDSHYWNTTGEAGQKDLVAACVNAVHNNFSGFPHITVTNGVRTVAIGEWSIWNGEANVTLK